MAVEAKVKVSDLKKMEREYPYLGMTEKGYFVLFTAPRCGTWLIGGDYPIGHTCKTWLEGSFTPLSPSESIILRNKA